MRLKVFIALTALSVASAFPAKLLRVPKIYNALITTKEKLLPSEAYPATTGPVFQPIGLTGEPVLLNPEAFARKSQPEPQQEDVEAPELISPEEQESKKGKPAPLTFYPRYSVYYPQQPFLPFPNIYNQPLLYTPLENGQQQAKPVEGQPSQPEYPPEHVEVDERDAANASLAPPVPELSPLLPAGSAYVKNNRPQNLEIPDVPPPPPPVGVPKPAEETDSEEPR